jgi:hypothetical protein
MQTGDNNLSTFAHGIPESIRKLLQVDTSGIKDQHRLSEWISLNPGYCFINSLDELATET